MKDKLVFFSVLIFVVILNFLEGYFLRDINSMLGLLLCIPNLVVFWLFVNLLGSFELKKPFNEKFKPW